MAKDLPDLSDMARANAEIACRVTPKAARNRITHDQGHLRVYVTAPPENGKANQAVRNLLAKAMGIPKTQLILIRGDTARDKVFRVQI